MKSKIDDFIKSNKISASKKSRVLNFEPKSFHFDGTWNRFFIEEGIVYFERMGSKDNGFEYEVISKLKVEDMGEYFYMIYNEIPLFLKIKNGRLYPVYISNIIDRLSFTIKHVPYFEFYKSLGIKSYIRSVCFNPNSINPYNLTEY